MKRFLIFLAKFLSAIILAVMAIVFVTNVSPVYNFADSKPFSGDDIFNPYASLDTLSGWKRANFHTHTRVHGIFNECEYWPAEVQKRYDGFGYDIVTFSNHNKLTQNPVSPRLQVNVYEHGWNIFKFHKLVFGCDAVLPYDQFLPFLASQRQFQMDLLASNSDFIQLNHPFRTNFTTKHIMESLTGYRITELDSGKTTEQEYWDWSLSAGHYTFGLANDDLHYPDRSGKIAIRCNWLNCPSAEYSDIMKTLLSGAYYSMRVPDYGEGDWEVKHRMNADLPQIENIGANGDTLFMTLSKKADLIKVYGQDHNILDSVKFSDSIIYQMRGNDHYARFTAYFDDGVVIYSNPFARYDSSVSESPYREEPHRVNWVLTILFNLFVLALSAGCIFLLTNLVKRKGS